MCCVSVDMAVLESLGNVKLVHMHIKLLVIVDVLLSKEMFSTVTWI